MRVLAIILRIVIALIVLAAGVAFYMSLVKNPIVTPQRPAMRTYPVAEVEALKPDQYQVILHSQGIVRPRVRTELTAEVSGRISA